MKNSTDIINTVPGQSLTTPTDSREVCEVCGTPGCIEGRGADFHVTRRFGSKVCDYTGTPPFADAEWSGKENDESDHPMCEWCASTGHPYGDESYGICKCPALNGGMGVSCGEPEF